MRCLSKLRQCSSKLQQQGLEVARSLLPRAPLWNRCRMATKLLSWAEFEGFQFMSTNSGLLTAMKECLRMLESSRSAQDDLVTSDLKEALRKRIAELELQEPLVV